MLAINTDKLIKLNFTSDKKERNIFYLRALNRSTKYTYESFLMGYSPWTDAIILAITSCWSSLKIKKRDNTLYALYGKPNEIKSLEFVINDTGFLATLGNEIKKFDFAEIKKIEPIGDFVIIWITKEVNLKEMIPEPSFGIPIYSNAFSEITREKFISILKNKT